MHRVSLCLFKCISPKTSQKYLTGETLTNVTNANIPVHIPGVWKYIWELNGTQIMLNTCGPGVSIGPLVVVLSQIHTPDWGMSNY